MTDFETLKLENFANGAAKELFARELNEVLKNIDDPNTVANKERKITLEFTIKPDERRKVAATVVDSRSRLAPVQGAMGTAYFGRRAGKLEVFHRDIEQSELNFESKPELVGEDVENGA